MLKKFSSLIMGISILFTLFSCPVGEDPNTRYSVSGTITYKLPGYPGQGLAGVDVKVKGTDSEYSTVTDENGVYSISNLPLGFYNIKPTKTGFSFSTLGVMLERNAINQDFEITGLSSGYSIDPWGFVWDSENRAATTYAQAAQICKDLGGRLPTPTEIYRNRYSTGKSTIANSNDTSYWLWTCIEWNSAPYQAIGMLGNGDISYASLTNAGVKFRCVWPDTNSDCFSGSNVNVNKLDNEKPFEFKINGNCYLMDTQDRPPDINYNVAIREAMFYHAFIPSLTGITAAIKANLPNGGAKWLYTSDLSSYSSSNLYTEIVMWTDTNASFPATYPGFISHAVLHNETISFRCIGLKYKPELHPSATITLGQPWSSENCIFSSIDSDLGGTSGTTYLDAINICFDDGGHLPTQQEIMQLVISGLPNGSNKWLWVSDYIANDQVALVRWNDVCKDFSGDYSTFGAWDNHSSSRPYWYRPIYYPINKEYNGPDPLDCPKGLYTYTKSLGNGNVIKIWIDAVDRNQKTFAGAVQDCYKAGGQLATRRDLVELLHNGLANGLNSWIWTADISAADSAHVIKWTGTNESFGDQDNGIEATELSTAETNVAGYRCIWTNELRIP
jgi:hypothetical protein